ncbi:MAG: hypothetical protein WBF71_16620 [Microthrixaceae bacterium]
MRIPITALAFRAAAGARDLVLNQPPTLGDSDCESLHDGLFAQPVNTVTSLSFLGVGLWAASRVPSLQRGDRAGATAFASLVALNGVGSAAYHGPQFPGSQTLHDLPAYGVVVVGAAVPLWRRVRGRRALPGWTNAKGLGILASNSVAAVSYAEGRSASRMCKPDSWVQFHGLWHLSTAAMMAVWATVLWPETDGHA